MSLNNSFRNRSTKATLIKVGKIMLMLVIISIPVVIIGRGFTTEKPTESKASVAGTSTVSVAGPQAVLPVNTEFVYTLGDPEDEIAPRLTFIVTDAEKRDEILVKGKKATAIDGRTFLIVNIKIDNDNPQGVEINTRDFFRLATNGNTNEWLAPDIHNDPVEVQAISTKYTRLGFPINEADTDLILQVGQIDDEKQQIPLIF